MALCTLNFVERIDLITYPQQNETKQKQKTKKNYKEVFGNDWYVQYLGCGDAIMNIRNVQTHQDVYIKYVQYLCISVILQQS